MAYNCGLNLGKPNGGYPSILHAAALHMHLKIIYLARF